MESMACLIHAFVHSQRLSLAGLPKPSGFGTLNQAPATRFNVSLDPVSLN
jgi:hypothetical protein